MAEAVPDLTDDQIEQLLSAAERSLAERVPETTAVAVKSKQQSLAANATKASAAQAGDGSAGKDVVKPSEELALRVPHLKSKEKKALPDNAGAKWNYMPRTKIEDPKVKREFQLLRLRGVLDPKKHFKKDNRKAPFPQYSQMGTIIEGPTEYYSARVNRKDRKQTLVEEVLASGEANSKFKTRYAKIQEKKTSGKKGHYKKLMARRKRG
ncbi:Fcf2-domain-containing protein [Cryphonectria parasitica EP155]|uniref:Fcf2-domain-containing protein n=1 Tax=Cryphonectria parasitica (strain ATCC 38755 / EP155) TaxID=660469 RepID=A0A9P4YB44_CRYP1|nr:Fcf2-domain-containing protein [Cryphonectria parasitica EP155]KAF3770364.1 Fcf2-domain-containing protein [Cryphonectria parasitica EP155]